MRPWPLVALVALAIAGCAQPVPTEAPVVVLPPPPPFTLHATVVDPAGGQGEPSLAVLADGTLFTNGKGPALPGEDMLTGTDEGAVYRSTDGGFNWTRLAPGMQTPNLDADLVAGADGTLWYDTLYVGCTSVATSKDKGDTWQMTPLGCNVPGDDRQYVVPTTPGTAFLFSHQLPSYYQSASKTTDGGMTWVPTAPMEFPDHHLQVNGGSGWSGGGFWNAKTGTVFATWSQFPGPVTGGKGFLPAYAKTSDGLTWQGGVATPTSTGEGLGLSLVVGAADDAGNVYLAWASIDIDAVSVYVAGSKDDGATWSSPQRIDTGGNSKVFPAIAAGADGHVAVAYYEANLAGYPASDDIKQAAWNVTLAWSTDFFGGAAWNHGNLTTTPVRFGPICPDGSGCNQDREFLDYFALKRLPTGQVGSIWNDSVRIAKKTVNVYGVTADDILGPVAKSA